MEFAARHPRWFYALCVALVAILAAAAFAEPRYADPPISMWIGHRDDGTEVTLTLTADGGMTLVGVMPEPILGAWTWNPISAVAGVLYCDPADSHKPSSYNVVYITGGRVELSNFYFTVILHRMI